MRRRDEPVNRLPADRAASEPARARAAASRPRRRLRAAPRDIRPPWCGRRRRRPVASHATTVSLRRSSAPARSATLEHRARCSAPGRARPLDPRPHRPCRRAAAAPGRSRVTSAADSTRCGTSNCSALARAPRTSMPSSAPNVMPRVLVYSVRPAARSSSRQRSNARRTIGTYAGCSKYASRMMRVRPCDEPRPCGGENRSMPNTRRVLPCSSGERVHRRAPHRAHPGDDDVVLLARDSS